MNSTTVKAPDPDGIKRDPITWGEAQAAVIATEWRVGKELEKPLSPAAAWMDRYRERHGIYRLRDQLISAGAYIDRLYEDLPEPTKDDLADACTLSDFDYVLLPDTLDAYLAHLVLVGADSFDHSLIPRYFKAVVNSLLPPNLITKKGNP